MSPIFRIAAPILLLLASVSLSPAHAADKVRDAVERGNRAFIAAYAAHDSAKIGALYALDASAFPPGQERVKGRDAIRKFWQGNMDAGVTNVTLKTIDVVSSGALASESGEFALDAPGKDGKAVHVTGKYVVVWKRNGGVWQLYRDIWNDTPAR